MPQSPLQITHFVVRYTHMATKKSAAKIAAPKKQVVADPVTTEVSEFQQALLELTPGLSKKGVLNRKKLMAAMRKRGFKITLKEAAKYLA